MIFDRRKMLALLGAAPVVPMASSAAAAEKGMGFAKDSFKTEWVPKVLKGYARIEPEPEPWPEFGGIEPSAFYDHYVSINGIPEWEIDKIRERTNLLRIKADDMDPDILIKKSWSLTYKTLVQKERCFIQELETRKVRGINYWFRKERAQFIDLVCQHLGIVRGKRVPEPTELQHE